MASTRLAMTVEGYALKPLCVMPRLVPLLSGLIFTSLVSSVLSFCLGFAVVSGGFGLFLCVLYPS
jgi:hypothetical protein